LTVDYLECLRQQEYLAGLYRLPQAQQFLGALAKEAEKLDDSFIKGSYRLSLQPIYAGHPFFLEQQIVPLIQTAARSLPQSWSLLPELLFKKSGFVWFEKPQPYHKHLLGAFGWVPMHNGIVPGTLHQADTVNVNRGDHILVTYFGYVPGEDKILYPVGLSFIAMESTLDQTVDAVLAQVGPKYSTAYLEMVFFFAAFLSFINQRIVDRRSIPLPRAWRKRRARQGNAPIEIVKAIVLRQQYQQRPATESEAINWRWRWIVSGHWRNQYRPSKKDHFPKWIMPYVKGPGDKPVKPRATPIHLVAR